MRSQLVLAERMLLRDTATGVVDRLLHVDRSGGRCWLINTDDDSWPYSITIAVLGERHERGELAVELDDKWAANRIGMHETDTEAAKRHEKRYRLIEPLVRGENEAAVLIPRVRAQLIRKRLGECQTTRQTLSALLKKYWKRGMAYDALQTDYHKCGHRGQIRNFNGLAKAGRRRRITPGTGMGVNEDVRRKLKSGVDYYLSRKNPSMQEAHDKIIGLYFSHRVVDENGKTSVILVPENERPTLRQFRHYLENNESYRNRRIRRGGQKTWDLAERPLLGTNTGDVQGPGDRFQVDATVANAYLVSQFDRRRIVGRPVIYFAVDVFSRLITGVYVGFEGPSWIGAMMVLVNMVTPKADFCRRIGLDDIDDEAWPSCEAPKRILADRGELASVELGKNIVDKLRIDIENASPGRPDLKALVERRFGIVPAKFKQFTPGYVEADSGERGAPDYRRDARLNLAEFTQFVVLAVIEHNNEPIKGYVPPAGMIVEGVEPTPVNLWNWGIRHLSGALKRISVEEMMLNVMPMEKAKITSHGIFFRGAYYSSPTALREDWFAMARRKEWKVDVSFDPRDMGTVYLRNIRGKNCHNGFKDKECPGRGKCQVWSEDEECYEGYRERPKGYEVCTLLPRSVEFQGKSLFEVEELDEQNKINIAAGGDARQAKRIACDDKMADTEGNAKAAMKALGPDDRSKAERTSGIRDNHAQEKEAQRTAEVFPMGEHRSSRPTPQDAAPNPPKATEDLEGNNTSLELLRKMRVDRAGGTDEHEACG